MAQADESSGVLEEFGRYSILEELGRGGQGVVYLARDNQLQRRVALKLLASSTVTSRSLRARLLREAEATAKLDHPAICSVYEVGEQDGVPFISMRYVPGESLAKRIASLRSEQGSGTDLSFFTWVEDSAPDAVPEENAESQSGTGPSRRGDITRVIELIEKAARALHVAHEAGLVHRDVKPGNIMVTAEGEPVVLDFGLARDEADQEALTQTGQLAGTPAYMAPEQIAGQRIEIDRRVDVYALGVTLFECLTLQRPFSGVTPNQLYHQITVSQAPDVRRLNRSVPRDLKGVIEVALEKDRNRRYQTAEALADDLRRVRTFEPIQARPPGAIVRLKRLARRRPAVVTLLTVLLIGLPLLTALGGYLLASRDAMVAGRHQLKREQVEALLQTGFLELGEGSRQRAVDAFERALAIERADREALAGVALALMRLDRPTDALARLDRHPGLVADVPVLARIRFDALEALGRGAESKAPEPAGGRSLTAFEHFVAGEIAIERGHEGAKEADVQALHHFSQAVYLSSRPRAIHYFGVAHAAGHAGDQTAARRVAGALISHWPDSFEAWFWRGFAFLGIGELDEAATAFRRCVALRPDHPGAWINLGNALKDREEWAGAQAAYETALRFDPGSAKVLNNLGNVMMLTGDATGAIAKFNEAIQQDPTLASAHFNLGDARSRQQEFERAAAAYREGLRHFPRKPIVLFALGHALIRLGDARSSAAAYRQGLKLAPKDIGAQANFSYVLVNLEEWSGAEAAARAALSLDAGHSLARFTLGVSLLRQQRLDEALDAFHDVTQPALLEESNRAIANCRKAIIRAAAKQAQSIRVEGPLDEQAVRSLRRTVLELESLVTSLDESADASAERLLGALKRSPSLTNLRGEALFRRLPRVDRRRWRALWADVDSLMAELR